MCIYTSFGQTATQLQIQVLMQWKEVLRHLIGQLFENISYKKGDGCQTVSNWINFIKKKQLRKHPDLIT